MLNVGDAVLTFLGDSSQLDQVFARIPAQTEAAMAAAAGGVAPLGTALQGVNFELDATATNVPYAGEQISQAMDKASVSVRGQSEELKVVEELFGVRLPRSINRFLAELPGVGAALSAAFAATAVIFLLDVIVKAIDKHEQLAKAKEIAALATENLAIKERDHTTSLELTNLKLDDQIAKLEGRPDRNRLKEALLEAGIAADELAATFGKDFEQVDAAIITATAFFGRFEQDMRSWWELLTGPLPESFAANWHKVVSGTKDVEAALAGVQAQVIAINKLRAQPAGKTEDEQVAAAKALADAYGRLADTTKQAMTVVETQAPHSTELIEKLSGAVVSANAAQKDFGLEAENVHKRVQLAADQTAEAERLAIEKAVKFAEAGAKKQEQIYFAIAKAHAVLQKQLEKDADDARKVIELGLEQQLKDQVNAISAREKAENQAAVAALKSAENNAKVETATVTEKYSEQEKAITQLGAFKLLSAQQTSQRLEVLYTQENSKLIAILNDLLKKEQDAIKAAQTKLDAAQNNPFIDQKQIDELKKLLQQAEQAEAATQVKIETTTKQFQDRQLTLDKGYYGQALALAVAAGNQQLALDLKQHQSALLTIQDQIALTKARHDDVTALKAQEKEEQNQINALVKEATQIGKLRQAWDIFSNDFAKSAKTDETTAQQMAQSFVTAAQGLETGIQSAFAAMVTGTESAGKALEKAALTTIGKIAEQWGAFFIAKGIGDAFFDPPAAAAEFAAGAALEALGGLLGGLGSASSTKSAGTAKAAPAIAPNASTTPAATQQPTTTTTNVPLLYGGGLVTQKTLAIVGDAPGGGNQKEAVIPLDDPGVMRQIAQAFAKASGEGSGGITNNFRIGGMISTTDLSKVARMITRGAQTGRLRMSVSNSNRVTRKV